MLGSLDEVVECVMNADVLKPTQEAAEDILALISGKGKDRKRYTCRLHNTNNLRYSGAIIVYT